MSTRSERELLRAVAQAWLLLRLADGTGDVEQRGRRDGQSLLREAEALGFREARVVPRDGDGPAITS
jgi:hypothetical protein